MRGKRTLSAWWLLSRVLFGLFVAFTAAQVASDSQQAAATLEREAGALRSAAILAGIFPADSANHIRTLIASYIQEAANHEWPMLAHPTAVVPIMPQSLVEVLELKLGHPVVPLNPFLRFFFALEFSKEVRRLFCPRQLDAPMAGLFNGR
jgi:hypothetical protein